jgi:hypothetical protein
MRTVGDARSAVRVRPDGDAIVCVSIATCATPMTPPSRAQASSGSRAGDRQVLSWDELAPPDA